MKNTEMKYLRVSSNNCGYQFVKYSTVGGKGKMMVVRRTVVEGGEREGMSKGKENKQTFI